MTNYRNIRKFYTALYPSTKKFILLLLFFSIGLLVSFYANNAYFTMCVFFLLFMLPVSIFLYYSNRQLDIQKEYNRLQLEYMETLKKEALSFEKDKGLLIFTDDEKAYPQ